MWQLGGVAVRGVAVRGCGLYTDSPSYLAYLIIHFLQVLQDVRLQIQKHNNTCTVDTGQKGYSGTFLLPVMENPKTKNLHENLSVQ